MGCEEKTKTMHSRLKFELLNAQALIEGICFRFV